ncbi:hypothetical protein [Niastella populi]|uniref:hypothetical protein n=1 Tax=Niastella populi TaxID=550983 RepID=UPI001055EE24|nr:hypothetical protein [Niastella populi]
MNKSTATGLMDYPNNNGNPPFNNNPNSNVTANSEKVYRLHPVISGFQFYNGLEGFKDYSTGANSWDGIDLIQSSRTNNHRNYTWSSDLKELLTKYKTDNNRGVKVATFSYKNKLPD